MPKVISVHEYTLKAGVNAADFEATVLAAKASGLLSLPGLEACHLVKGLRGQRRGHYAAIWVYASREAWERLWGPLNQPSPRQAYPENWKVWETEILAPFLDGDPDQIVFTAYEELEEQ
jgi:hypothetical protein